MRMEEVARKYREGWKQEQQHGGGWRALYGTETVEGKVLEACVIPVWIGETCTDRVMKSYM